MGIRECTARSANGRVPNTFEGAVKLFIHSGIGFWYSLSVNCVHETWCTLCPGVSFECHYCYSGHVKNGVDDGECIVTTFGMYSNVCKKWAHLNVG